MISDLHEQGMSGGGDGCVVAQRSHYSDDDDDDEMTACCPDRACDVGRIRSELHRSYYGDLWG